MFSQIKYIKGIKRDFYSVDWFMPQGWDLGVLGVKNLSKRICDDTSSTARFSFCIEMYTFALNFVYIDFSSHCFVL